MIALFRTVLFRAITAGVSPAGVSEACGAPSAGASGARVALGADDAASADRGPRAVQAPCRPGGRRAVRGKLLVLAVALVTAVLLAAFLLSDNRRAVSTAGVQTESRRIEFFVTDGDAIRQGSSGDIVRAGDVLRFTYSAAEDSFLAVLSRTPDGRALIYVADPGARDAGPVPLAIPPGQNALLPVTVPLDVTIGEERLVTLLCRAPVALEPLRQALASGAALARLPAARGCAVQEILLVKRPR